MSNTERNVRAPQNKVKVRCLQMNGTGKKRGEVQKELQDRKCNEMAKNNVVFEEMGPFDNLPLCLVARVRCVSSHHTKPGSEFTVA